MGVYIDNSDIGNALEERGYKYHHSAWERGYKCRTEPDYAGAYKGRFGVGYKVHHITYESTSFHRISYYIKEEA